jgi:hypothetical protein
MATLDAIYTCLCIHNPCIHPLINPLKKGPEKSILFEKSYIICCSTANNNTKYLSIISVNLTSQFPVFRCIVHINLEKTFFLQS